jgi:hypothetical protein
MDFFTMIDSMLAHFETQKSTADENIAMLKKVRELALAISKGETKGSLNFSSLTAQLAPLSLITNTKQHQPTKVDLIEHVLREAGGGPLHVDVIIAHLKKFGVESDKRNVASALRKNSGKGKRFKALGGNTFELAEK